MDDQEQGDEMVAEDGGHPGLGEAGAQALLELGPAEQGLDEDQPREGGQPLVLEAEGGGLWSLRWVAALLCFTWR